MNDIHFNWEDCIGSGSFKKRRVVSWSPPPGVLKFNVDGAARGKSGPARIGRGPCNDRGETFDAILSKYRN